MTALDRDAVAICAHCGAGVCLDHAAVAPPVDPPARRIHCPSCC